MNRIDTRVAELRASRRKALIPFFTAGDPGLESTVPVMHALVAAGADLIELGVPFSDPMADGPVIQRSSERALARGAGIRYVLEAVRGFRATDNETPVVLMGYLNPIEMRGAERFAQEASAAGVDGLLLVDLPPEEALDARAIFNRHGLALVLLAAPTTSPDRLERIAREAQGYLYYVSFAGVTGADSLRPADVAERVAGLQRTATVPVVVGFGVKDAASAAALAPIADGVVVGSALVTALDHAGVAGAATAAQAFLAPLRSALDT
ncbi:MAG: tryptophan synthase subunit alpha [Gammaproteobacteria bacterium HGW-Gammaproteobacteria-4]|jgi:tryptophan synthase alpha chain|nr:MAG: tryptophan synthase subunit alpha [Gammaproteobacteria bacterium HGW-Gammaproteobacteria-4]